MKAGLVAYAILALVATASIGPATASVKDQALEEIAILDEPRPLDEFPILQTLRPYLPPLIVDWVIVKRIGSLDVPSDVDVRVDPDGRFVLVWPDGCEGRWDRERGAQREDDCRVDDDEPAPEACVHPDGSPAESQGDACPASCPHGSSSSDHDGTCPEPEVCPPDHIVVTQSDGSHRCDPPNNACPRGTEDNTADTNNTTTNAAACPDEPPTCPVGTLQAYDGTCVRTSTHTLWAETFTNDRTNELRYNLTRELKVSYAQLVLNVSYRAQTTFSYSFALFDENDLRMCWDDPVICPEQASGQRTLESVDDETRYIEHEVMVPHGGLRGNFTLQATYDTNDVPSRPPTFSFTLRGTPVDRAE